MNTAMKYEPTGPTHGKILVIDDNPHIQRAVFLLFRDRGYKILMSGNIADALSVVRSERPNLILMDLSFATQNSVTGASGAFSATEWLNQIPDAEKLPVVISSSINSEAIEGRALAAGAVGYLQKPFDSEKLFMFAKKHVPTRSRRLADNLGDALKLVTTC
jgi:CheY-like chemotaxis protein